MKIFIDAYEFKSFKSIPDHNFLLKKIKNESSKHQIIGTLVATFENTIEYNKNMIDEKVKRAKDGFKYFKKGGFFTILLIFIFLLSILIK